VRTRRRQTMKEKVGAIGIRATAANSAIFAQKNQLAR
jgi:hypothetical protein